MMRDLIKVLKGTRRLAHNMLEAYCYSCTCRMLRLMLINSWHEPSTAPLKAITSGYLQLALTELSATLTPW